MIPNRTGGLLAFALLLLSFTISPAGAQRRIDPLSLAPLVGRDYAPADQDERGLWDGMERLEEDLLASDLIVRDPALTAYVRQVVEKVAGPAAGGVRVVIMRSPIFNASMYPNGLMLVNSGLLLRVRNEAELAGVLGHEVGHYVRRHQVQQWRSRIRRRGMANFFAVGASILGAISRTNTYDTIQSINASVYFGDLAYSRNLESEADAMGIRLMAEAHYQPRAMAAIWEAQIEEEQARARMQNRRPRTSANMFASHPSHERRVLDMRASADALGERGTDVGEDRLRAALASWIPLFLKDQVLLNDAGTSFYILGRLAQGNWNGVLRYYEGEAFRLRDQEGDRARAEEAYALAVNQSDAPAEAWRAHGYALTRRGQAEAGRAALTKYLELAPGAADAAMVRASLGN